MPDSARAGDWVEIHGIVLEVGQRAPQVPDDTREVPLEMRVRGHALDAASVGEELQLRTAAGRILRGTLAAVNPVYPHGFGSPPPELNCLATELRAMLAALEETP
jgi:hypothetical protein